MLSLLMLIGASTATVDCEAFAARSAQPIEMQIDQISAKTLDPDASAIKPNKPWEPTNYRMGKLLYQGHGYDFRSSDSRFPAVADRVANSLGRICQFQTTVPDGYDSAHGRPLERGEITFDLFDPQSEVPSDSMKPDSANVWPVLDGYVPRTSRWSSVNMGNATIGLMRPVNVSSDQETAIVAFSSKGGSRSIIIATIRGDYSSIMVAPNIHGTGAAVFLTGRESDDSLRQVSFWLDGQTEAEITTRFTSQQ